MVVACFALQDPLLLLSENEPSSIPSFTIFRNVLKMETRKSRPANSENRRPSRGGLTSGLCCSTRTQASAPVTRFALCLYNVHSQKILFVAKRVECCVKVIDSFGHKIGCDLFLHRWQRSTSTGRSSARRAERCFRRGRMIGSE